MAAIHVGLCQTNAHWQHSLAIQATLFRPMTGQEVAALMDYMVRSGNGQHAGGGRTKKQKEGSHRDKQEPVRGEKPQTSSGGCRSIDQYLYRDRGAVPALRNSLGDSNRKLHR